MDDLCDEYGVPYHVRRDIHMKMFDGRSATDLMNFGELEQRHINALIAEARLMEQSNAKPTNDSTLHQFESELTESIVHTITIDANKAAPTTTIAVALPDGRFVYLPTNDSTPHQFELEFDDVP